MAKPMQTETTKIRYTEKYENPKYTAPLRASGGEKGLVSMAFIFAIQQYDPSPFYLLDEIDQNLDAVNAENIARMIKRNSESAQFLQVSLRKVTLKEADHVYGVTMHHNSGVSDVIGNVKLSEIGEKGEIEGS